MRNANGRFAPGNPGGPGRPRRETEAAYLQALRDSVDLDDWRAIVSRAVADAKQGDAKARDWLSRHLLPNSPDDVDPAPEAERLDLTPEGLAAVLADARTLRALADAADN